MIIFVENFRKVNSFEFWITAILESGKKINVFITTDYKFQDITNKKIKCLISAAIIRKIESETDYWNYNRLSSPSSITRFITGDIIHNYKIPSKWSKWKMISSSAIKTVDGIFLLNTSDFKDGQKIMLFVQRFDLLDWQSIKKPNES